MTTEIVKHQPQALAKKPSLRPMYSPDEMIEFHKDVTALITKALVKGQDYGSVPGINKDFLFKPGAERLCKAFGCTAHYDIVSSEVNYDVQDKVKTKYEEKTVKGRFSYTIRCSLKANDDRIIGDGIGLASTTEKKYSYAPCDNNNTVIKMAQKRALVAAVLNAFGLSDRFTQDEDSVEESKPSKPYSSAAEDVILFSNADQTQLDKLNIQLDKRGVPSALHLDVALALEGKPFNAKSLESVIKNMPIHG